MGHSMLLVVLLIVILAVVAAVASAVWFDSAPTERQLPPAAPRLELGSAARHDAPPAADYDEDEYEDAYEDAFDDFVTVEETLFAPARYDTALGDLFEPAGAFKAVGTNEADENSVCYVYGQTRRDCQCDECKQWRRARGI